MNTDPDTASGARARAQRALDPREARIAVLLALGVPAVDLPHRLGWPREQFDASMAALARRAGSPSAAVIVGHCHRRHPRALPGLPDNDPARRAQLTDTQWRLLDALSRVPDPTRAAAALALTREDAVRQTAAAMTRLGAKTLAHAVHLGHQLGRLPVADPARSGSSRRLRAALRLPGDGPLRLAELAAAGDASAAPDARIPARGEPVLRGDLRDARLAAALDVRQVAARLGWTPARIEQIEGGHAALTLAELAALAACYADPHAGQPGTRRAVHPAARPDGGAPVHGTGCHPPAPGTGPPGPNAAV